MQLNNSIAIAAFQDCPTSPTGFVMDGDEYVAVALPHPWPEEVASKEAADLLALTPSIAECLGLAPISEAKKEHLRDIYKAFPWEDPKKPMPDWLVALLNYHGVPEPGTGQKSRLNAASLLEGVTVDDFNAYMPMHSYIFTPSREMWPAASVNARIPPISDNGEKPVSASTWLDKNKLVEQMTWAPGLPMLIPNRLISDGGWIERNGVTCFNLYRPPPPQHGNPADAGPWLVHVNNVFLDDADHIIKWLAQRVQHPSRRKRSRRNRFAEARQRPHSARSAASRMTGQ